MAQISLRATDLEPMRLPLCVTVSIHANTDQDNEWDCYRGDTYAPKVTGLLCLSLSFSVD